MEYMNDLIVILLLLNLGISKTSLVIEEDANEKIFGGTAISSENKPATPIKNFTSMEKEKLLKILEDHYKSDTNMNYTELSSSLSHFLITYEMTSLKIEPTKSGRRPSNKANHDDHCARVGSACSPEGWISKSGKTENEDSEGGCCSEDLCVQGNCCIPTPSKRGSSHCDYNHDCCNGGICDQESGKCFIKLGQSCNRTKECYESQCINNVCCVGVCSNSTKSTANKCTADKDCCGSANATVVKCDTTTGKCKSTLGQACTSSTYCPNPCYGNLDCKLGICCYPDNEKGCTATADCCFSSTGSQCIDDDNNANTPKVCTMSGGSTRIPDFKRRGEDF